MKNAKLKLGIVLILTILGTACQNKEALTSGDLPAVSIQPKPKSRPQVVDNSPILCPECLEVNEQRMWKFTERDFLLVKEKLLEQEEYIDYLIDIIFE